MNLRYFLLLLLTISLLSPNKAQDTLTYVNGKSKVVKVAYETSMYVFYHEIKNQDTSTLGKKKMAEKEDLFQIAYLHQGKNSSDQRKVVQVYQQDSLEENYLSIDEMKRYMNGRNSARKNYKAKKYALVGALGGAGSAYLGPFWGFIPISIYTGVSGVWAIKPFYKVDNPDDLKDPYFAEGYKQVALSKQAKNSAIGAAIGFVTSICFLQLIFY